jgi:hypothetical protein
MNACDDDDDGRSETVSQEKEGRQAGNNSNNISKMSQLLSALHSH